MVPGRKRMLSLSTTKPKVPPGKGKSYIQRSIWELSCNQSLLSKQIEMLLSLIAKAGGTARVNHHVLKTCPARYKKPQFRDCAPKPLGLLCPIQCFSDFANEEISESSRDRTFLVWTRCSRSTAKTENH